MSLLELPGEIIEIIIKKTFINNPFILEIVCKTFKNILDKYFDRGKMEDFMCKSCNEKSYSICESGSWMDCECHIKGCKTRVYKITECMHCNFCGENCDIHNPIICENAQIRVRGICGFCYDCLFNINKYECLRCGLEFMSTDKELEPFCQQCLPIFRSYPIINPERKQILPTDEPFCY